MDPNFWNVISIRESHRPRIDPRGFRQIHPVIFDDVVGTVGLEANSGFTMPARRHLNDIFRFADSVAGDPLLIHCWAGVSRSTGVALALIARALHNEGCEAREIEREAPPLLLAIRPQAAPNPLVLQLGLEEFLDAAEVPGLLAGLLNHPKLFENKFPGASPGE
jgi:predicted protein tyrosine phosphatase